ncbi:MAG: biopolymer transporter ExbD [Bdellovibrionota bacterium]
MSFHIDGRSEFDENYKGRLKLLAEINMTPFVDVCLVLLIIFMVTAPFAISGINIQVPQTKAKPLSMSNESLILSVTKKGEFYFGKNKIQESELIPKIRLAAGGSQKTPVFIRADKNVPYEKVMTAMAAAQSAGVERIGMIGENKQGKK